MSGPITEHDRNAARTGEFKRPTARRVRAIRDRLELVYGIPGAGPHGHPIAELILTVLSQSTNDRNRDVAYTRLRDRLPHWADVREAPVDEIEEAIRPGGISKVKSARIKDILVAITETSGHGLSLDWLAQLTVPEAQEYLCSLPGVGRKTAACVLLFALGMRDIPVDTHVSRVGSRLGLFRPRRRLHGDARRDAGADPARRRARTAHQPAAPRPPHLPRTAAGMRRLRAGADVPERGAVRLISQLSGRGRVVSWHAPCVTSRLTATPCRRWRSGCSGSCWCSGSRAPPPRGGVAAEMVVGAKLVDHARPYGDPAEIGGVSCPTQSLCIGVGSHGTVVATRGATTKVVNSGLDSYLVLHDVSCPTTKLCVAIAGNTVRVDHQPRRGEADLEAGEAEGRHRAAGDDHLPDEVVVRRARLDWRGVGLDQADRRRLGLEADDARRPGDSSSGRSAARAASTLCVASIGGDGGTAARVRDDHESGGRPQRLEDHRPRPRARRREISCPSTALCVGISYDDIMASTESECRRRQLDRRPGAADRPRDRADRGRLRVGLTLHGRGLRRDRADQLRSRGRRGGLDAVGGASARTRSAPRIRPRWPAGPTAPV